MHNNTHVTVTAEVGAGAGAGVAEAGAGAGAGAGTGAGAGAAVGAGLKNQGKLRKVHITKLQIIILEQLKQHNGMKDITYGAGVTTEVVTGAGVGAGLVALVCGACAKVHFQQLKQELKEGVTQT